MSPRDVVLLATRVIAIYLGTRAIIGLVNYIAFLVDSTATSSGTLVATLIAMGIIAALLWRAAPAIAEAAAGDADPNARLDVGPLDRILGVGVFLVGLVLVSLGARDLIVALTTTPISTSFRIGDSGTLASLVQCGIGVGLLLAGRQMIRRPADEPAVPDP